MELRRVVVTGMGMLTPLARGVGPNWDRLLRGDSGVRVIDSFRVDDLACRIAGQIPLNPEQSAGAPWYVPDDWMDERDRRRVDEFIPFALVAAAEAVEDSGWNPDDQEDRDRTGVLVGSGIGGLQRIYETSLLLEERGPRRVSPFFIPGAIANMASGHISIQFGFRGPNHAVVTACATGTHAIGDAARLIMFDDADVMIAGGTEGAVNRLGMVGFTAARAVSTGFNDTPEKASRPWDRDRDGFVMGEGAGVVVLEELEHARARGATIHAEIIGYGLSGDAYHVTAPAPDGSGGYRAMAAALKRSGLTTADIDYINAHGTSTPLGDEIELNAVMRLFGDDVDNLCMSSTKSAVGHLLGAAGAVEAIYCIKALNEGVVPPTLNLENPSEGCDMNLVPLTAQERPVRNAMSNSFGFGGTNATLIMTRAP